MCTDCTRSFSPFHSCVLFRSVLSRAAASFHGYGARHPRASTRSRRGDGSEKVDLLQRCGGPFHRALAPQTFSRRHTTLQTAQKPRPEWETYSIFDVERHHSRRDPVRVLYQRRGSSSVVAVDQPEAYRDTGNKIRFRKMSARQFDRVAADRHSARTQADRYRG